VMLCPRAGDSMLCRPHTLKSSFSEEKLPRLGDLIGLFK
jgi:hypothetical protein